MRRALPQLRSPLYSTYTPPAIHTTPAFTRSFSSKLTIPDRLRRKLWGSDAPPGPEDPYSKVAVPAAVDPLTIDRTNYVQATDARTLPIAGHEEPLGVWEVDSFAPVMPMRDTEILHRAVHRAVVETFVFHLNGRDAGAELTIDTTVAAEDATGNVNIKIAENGDIKFEFLGAEVEASILSSFKSTPKVEAEEREIVEEAIAETKVPEVPEVPKVPEIPGVLETATEGATAEVIEVAATAKVAAVEVIAEAGADATELPRTQWLEEGLAGSGWVKLPLTQDAYKFAIVKRVLQLTGQKVPDAVISQAKVVSDLLVALITPPKPDKLADELAQTELINLPNVKLFSSRIRPLDKERVIGRALPIEKVIDHTYKGIDMPQKVFRGHVVYR